jgi:hypothetical protein
MTRVTATPIPARAVLCVMSSQNRNPLSKDVNDACIRLFIRQRGIIGLDQAVDLGMSKYTIRTRLTPRTVGPIASSDLPARRSTWFLRAACYCRNHMERRCRVARNGRRGMGTDGARKWRIEVLVDSGASNNPADWLTLHRTTSPLLMIGRFVTAFPSRMFPGPSLTLERPYITGGCRRRWIMRSVMG